MVLELENYEKLARNQEQICPPEPFSRKNQYLEGTFSLKKYLGGIFKVFLSLQDTDFCAKNDPCGHFRPRTRTSFS